MNRNTVATVVKFGIALVAGFAIAPFIFAAIGGLIGLLVAALVAGTAISIAPWVAMKLANVKVGLVKSEAAQNPIPTLQNVFMERKGVLEKFGNDLTSFKVKVRGFKSKLDGFKRTWPEKAAVFEEQLAKMQELARMREEQYKRAQEQLNAFALKITEAEAIWDMSQAAKDMNDAAGMQGDVLAEIKTRTAIDSVEESMNESFVHLEQLMLERRDDSVLTLSIPERVAA